MFSGVAQNLRLKDLIFSADLAFDRLVMGGDPDISPAERRVLVLAVRDIPAEAGHRADAEAVLQDAYLAARRRAHRLGYRLQSWPDACPWRVPHVLVLLARMAEALPAEARASGEPPRGDERFPRSIGGLLRTPAVSPSERDR